ncbi:hypothetical protein AB0C51_09045, partial [Streptomyces pathocidini]
LAAQSERAVRLGIGLAGALAVALALRLCLRRGPLSLRGGGARGAGLWTCWLIGYLLFGDALLKEAVEAPAAADFEPWPASAPSAAPAVVALALSVAPAVWCARWFAVRARLRLSESRGLREFSARVRPLVPVATGWFLLALAGLLLAARLALGAGGVRASLPALASATALGALLFVARLLAVHGRASAAAHGLAAACAIQAAALGALLAARLAAPGGPLGGVARGPVEAVAAPVRTVVGTYGPGAVPLAACAAAAVALLAQAMVTASRATAHTEPPAVP